MTSSFNNSNNPGPVSRELFARAQKKIPGGVNSPVRAFRNVNGEPFFVKKAKGCRIWDADDRELIDFVGTWGPAILGHAPEVVIDAVKNQVALGTSYGIPTQAEVEMAELICDWVPTVEMIRMVNSGTEATMSCIRLARGFTRRSKIVKFEGCYHGHVDSLLVAAGSGALTHGEPDSAGVPKELADLTICLPYNDFEALESVFAQCGEQIAGVIVEAFPANAGLFFPKPGFLARLRELTKQYGAVLIFDEVMTGFRLARGGVQELIQYQPDLTAMGKVIGGGLPVGAFGGKAEIMCQLAPLGPVYQAGTLSGNPVAIAAGLAQLAELERIHAYEKLEQLGSRLETGVRTALEKSGQNWTFHRSGSMFCLFFTEKEVFDLKSAQSADREIFTKFFNRLLSRGIYLAPSPYETSFISTAHDESVIDRAIEEISQALKVL